MVKGIIFDVDGTILDSMQIWGELGKRYLASVGIEAAPGLAKLLFPMSLNESSEYLKKEYNIADTTDKITQDTLKIIEGFYRDEAVPKKGAVEFIKEMNSRGIPMVVATSGDGQILETVFKRLEIAECFRDILTCSALNTNKRVPDIYLKAADILGTTPEETVVFEDVLHAIKAAKSAGFVTVAVEDDASIAGRCEIREAADYYIKDFTDLDIEANYRLT